MTPADQIVVPAALAGFLSYVFDKLKPWLGQFGWFKQSNGNHAANLRTLFFIICALAVLIFALSTGLAPHDFDAGVLLLQRILTTAGFMTAGGHLVYDQLSGNAAERAADRKPVMAPGITDPDLIYPPSNYDAGGDLRASAATPASLPTLSAEPPAQ